MLILIRIFICVLVTTTLLYAQDSLPCMEGRFRDSIFQHTTTYDIIYGGNINSLGNFDTLKLDFYQPVGDTMNKRPLIIWLFGGGYVGGNKSALRDYAMYFTKRGYTNACIQYRTGVPLPRQTPQYRAAILRSVQDLKASIRFFKANAQFYGIDTSRIYVGGASAGGMTALTTALWDDSLDIW
ncbi:MAG: alpha/beta hydrolase, partial [Bacteroidia bacterium]|nr:alpha/beta hydrolase [Bacteroidia bacterium]